MNNLAFSAAMFLAAPCVLLTSDDRIANAIGGLVATAVFAIFVLCVVLWRRSAAIKRGREHQKWMRERQRGF